MGWVALTTLVVGNPFWLIASRGGTLALLLALAVAFLPAVIAWRRPLRDRARYSVLLLCALSVAYGGWAFVVLFALIAPRVPAGGEPDWPHGVPHPDDPDVR